MATVTGLTVVKSFTYRGDATEEFSNTYHFKGAPPVGDTAWQTLLSEVVGKEQGALPASVKWSRAYGYDSDDPAAHHVFAYDYGTTGPPGAYVPIPATEIRIAGDQAACVWWRLDRLNTRGKPIYLRKYIHGGYVLNTDTDSLSTNWLNALRTYSGGAGMMSIHGGLRSRSHDDNVQASDVIPYITTRTLKRRGKRPKTGS